jgi:hypothetical protein
MKLIKFERGRLKHLVRTNDWSFTVCGIYRGNKFNKTEKKFKVVDKDSATPTCKHCVRVVRANLDYFNRMLDTLGEDG